MADNRLYVACKPTTLSRGTALGGTELYPSVIQDREGNSLSTMATYFGTKGYGVISPGRDREEHFTFTGISEGTLTGVSHITMTAPYTETSGVSEAHAAGETIVILSNTPGFYNDFVNKQNDETIVGTYTFNELPTLDSYEAPTNSAQFAPKGYVDSVVGGLANTDRLVVAGTAGETISAGQLVYFDTGTNNEWMKCDADTAASVDNVILGIAQGAGTDGNTISGGVLLKGLDSNQSGMTQGDPMYASNTAGAISATPGTTEVAIGAARSATTLYFEPRFPQQLTEAQQDLLDGITASAAEINITDGLTATTAQLNEAGTFFGATDLTGAEAETLSSGVASDASSLHYHKVGSPVTITSTVYTMDYGSYVFDLTNRCIGGWSDTNAVFAELLGTTTTYCQDVKYRDASLFGFQPVFSYISDSSFTVSSSATDNGIVYISSDRWNSITGAIKKNGSSVTISGTSRVGPLGHDPVNSYLLVLYSTTAVARFSGISGTTITNTNSDITLDTAVARNAGFIFDSTNTRYIFIDSTNKVIRRFDSSGTTIDTVSISGLVDNISSANKIMGLSVFQGRVMVAVSTLYQVGANSAGTDMIMLSTTFYPTSMTV